MVIIVDTLSFRANFDSIESVFDFLGFDYGLINQFEFSDKKFNYNYLCSYFFEGIKIGCDGSKGWKYYIHMSGRGCRTFEDFQSKDFSWYRFFKKLNNMVDNHAAAITRIDLACDEHDGFFNINRLENSILKDKFLSRCPKSSMRCIKFGEECLYVGSPQSLSMLRIYNKKLERGYKESDEDVPHWWRCEFQLRDEHAQQIVSEWVHSGEIGRIFSGHVLKHIRFITKTNYHDGTAHRVNTASWWRAFLGDAEKIDWVSVKGSQYNLSKAESYALKSAGSSVLTLIKALDLSPQDLFKMYTDNDEIHLRGDQKLLLKKLGVEEFIPQV